MFCMVDHGKIGIIYALPNVDFFWSRVISKMTFIDLDY